MAATKTAAKGKEVELKIESPASIPLPEVTGMSNAQRQDKLEEVTSLSQLRDVFGTQELDWQQIEPSFDVVDKATFEGIPVIIGAFRFNQSTKIMKKNIEGNLIPSEFVSVLAAGYDPDTEMLTTPWVVFNDGGTGIYGQLQRYADRFDGQTQLCPPVKINKGLRRSEYDFDNGETVGRATTWYLG